jgi:hypothetical protein
LVEGHPPSSPPLSHPAKDLTDTALSDEDDDLSDGSNGETVSKMGGGGSIHPTSATGIVATDGIIEVASALPLGAHKSARVPVQLRGLSDPLMGYAFERLWYYIFDGTDPLLMVQTYITFEEVEYREVS